MRISAIAPVGRSHAAPIDSVSWYGASTRARSVSSQSAPTKSAFLKVLNQLEEQPQHAQSQVVEVVFAPGLYEGHSTRMFRLSSLLK